ncbi:olfactory receptor 4S2-like [Rhineura floridana]|uniref:olfactory receptor 4S2-like n=1 Tax=Rhineura floridana TaxID=261503 RepID=UPI002AC807C2|nr:olfactory receptor 4S2-like [Rhineura floridana]
MENTNNVTEFIFLGLTSDPNLQKAYFGLFLVFYTAILLGNLLIIVTVKSSPRLNSPMYFFLSYLSLVDICYSSVTTPKLIADFLVEKKTISFAGCIMQLFGFHFFGCTEIFLLTVMAFDRYIAICKPLHYTNIMSKRVCSWMVGFSWVGGFLHSLLQTLLTINLPFCGPNEIDHYFCDVHPLLKLACADTYIVVLIVIVDSGIISLSCFLALTISYIIILVSLRTHSSEGRLKALSTCASHITVVILFFGPCIFIYLRPSATFSEDKNVAIFYTVITPMLNPLIYTLRNEEVKSSMRKLGSKKRLIPSQLWFEYWAKPGGGGIREDFSSLASDNPIPEMLTVIDEMVTDSELPITTPSELAFPPELPPAPLLGLEESVMGVEMEPGEELVKASPPLLPRMHCMNKLSQLSSLSVGVPACWHSPERPFLHK